MEEEAVVIGAMMEVPVSALKANYKTLLNKLTVRNPEHKTATAYGGKAAAKKVDKHIYFYEVHQDTKSISIPRAMGKEYIRKNVPKVYQLSMGGSIGIGYSENFKLRPKQASYIIDSVLYYIKNTEKERDNIDILLNAQCGSGKTIMALYLASYYRRRCIVCVTTRKIGEQFQNAIATLFPGWTCGWAEDGKTYDITIGTYALLSDDRYSYNWFTQFGHIILDEYHRCGAATYNKVLWKAPCRYRTSLTATFRRKDGLQKILKLHAGVILEMERNEQIATIVPTITGADIQEDFFRPLNRWPTLFKNLTEYSDIAVRSKATERTKSEEVDRGLVTFMDKRRGEIVVSSIITNTDATYNADTHNFFGLGAVSAPLLDTEITLDCGREDLILKIIRACYRQGRRIIFLAKRKEQLYTLCKRFNRYGMQAGVYVSDKDKEYREYFKHLGHTAESYKDYLFNKARIIFGIDKLAEEGMDAPLFDTLIYGHTVRDIEQSIGRILRELPEGSTTIKQPPMAFYLLDNVSMFKNAFYSEKTGARKMFVELGHKVMEEKTIGEIVALLS